MKDAKERVYDTVYSGKEFSYESSHGLISFLYKKLLGFEVNRYQVVYNLLPSAKERLLDVGCGEGDFIFRSKAKFKECYGIDVSSLRIERAEERSKEILDGDNIHFCDCDVDEGIPFNDSFFDVVTCIAVLEHVFNPPNVLDEIHRVLKPGGTFIVQVPNFAWLPYRIQLLFGKLPKTGGIYLGADWEHLHNFTKTTLYKLLMAKKFQIKDVSCSGVFVKYRQWWQSLLGGDLIVKSVAY
jgi:ubiquinone/menaquinone biosynthesis C-methylase UbiE